MPKLFAVTLCLLTIVAATGAIACSDDGSDAPDDTDTPTAAAVTGGGGAAVLAEARELCPAGDLDSCIESWLASSSLSGQPVALCVNEDSGTWFKETPGGVLDGLEGVQVGDACGNDPSHTVVALQNYP